MTVREPTELQRWLAVALAGLAWGLAPADLSGAALVLLGMVALAWSLEGRWYRDAARGLLLGMIWFSIALSWLFAAWATLTSPAQTPLVVGLIGAEALLPTAVLGLAGWAVGRGVSRTVALGCAWALGSGLCGWLQPVPTGPSLFLAGGGPLLVALALGGRPLLVGGLAGLGAGLLERPRLASGVGLLWLVLGMGWWTVESAPAGMTRVGLVQPGTGAVDGRNHSTALRRASKLMELVESIEGVDWVATPEGAWPLNGGDANSRDRAGFETAWKGQPPVVVGATLWGSWGATNSLLTVREGRVTDRYDKHNLVPGAEETRFGIGTNLYIRGEGTRVLEIEGIRAGALICYEDMLPAAVRAVAAESPDLLLAATNDAWLGPNRGSLLHVSAARIAAVETGLWVVRPTASGRSAVIDQRGILRWSTPWVDGDAEPDRPGVTGIVDVQLRRPALCGARIAPLFTCLALLLLLSAAWRRSEEQAQ